MRSPLLLIGCSCHCLALAGCFGSGPTPAAKSEDERPYVDQAIRIAVPAELGFRNSWDGPLIEWQTQTGATAELFEYDPNRSEQTIVWFRTGSGATLLVFPLEQLGDLIADENMAPIPESSLHDPAGVNWSDLFAGLREGVASPNKKPTVVPVSCPVLVCYYRRDLLEQASLSPPQTWEDYQKLLDTLESWAPGLTAVEPWGPDFRGTMFLARSVPYAKHPSNYSLFFDIETAAPLIDRPGFVRGLETAQKAWPRLSPDFKELTPAECRRRILQGKSALAISFEPGIVAAAADARAASDSADRRAEGVSIGVCRLPGAREVYNPSRKSWEPVPDKGINQVTLCGFAGLAVAASNMHSELVREAAWNAVSRMGPAGFVAGFPPGTTGFCRESQIATGGSLLGDGLLGDEATLYLEVAARSFRDTRVVVDLPVAARSQFHATLSESLTKVLSGESTPAEGLNGANQSWRSLVDQIGPAILRDGYRAALGLRLLAPRPATGTPAR
jgi:ABC-type glycerol-3-phosphate transport system substrate-binding protein